MGWLFGGCALLVRGGLPWIQVSEDGRHFVQESGARFVIWGVNYDHDAGPDSGALLDEYWDSRWSTVVEDLGEIKALGANLVRIHLQIGLCMADAENADPAYIARLTKFLDACEALGLYVDVTGLACYHLKHIPEWYANAAEVDRWAIQARFWEAISRACADRSVVFCYDLMNEPIIPGKKETEWLTGNLGGKYFVQRLVLDPAGRGRDEIARAWIEKMVVAIRAHDTRHLITLGVIPWVLEFPAAQPFFYKSEVGGRLDFVSVHFYPRPGEVDAAITALRKYEMGKPLVIEEIFPLKAGLAETSEFIKQTREEVGKVSFPSSEDVKGTTIIVIANVIFFAIFLFLVDQGWVYVFKAIEWVVNKIVGL